MMLERQTVLHRLRWKLSQQSPARPFVRTWMSHGHNGIHGSHKGYRLWRTCQLFGSMHHQMSTCREAHATNTVSPHSIFFRVSPHTRQCPRQVIETRWETAPPRTNMKRKGTPPPMAILQHESCDTVFRQPSSHLFPFRHLVQPEVAASGTDNDPRFRRVFLRDIGCQLISLHGGGYK